MVPSFPAGDKNIVHVLVQKTTGSGPPRRTVYANGAETDNKLVFVGTLGEFTTAIAKSFPHLPPEFFEHAG